MYNHNRLMPNHEWYRSWAFQRPVPYYVIEQDVIYNEDFFVSEEDPAFTELIRAVIQCRSAEHIDFLICGGEDVNYPNSRDDYKTALHYAVSHRRCNIDVILTLLNRGANINARSHRDRRTPVHFAVQNPYMKPEIIRALLTRQGADVNVLSGSDCKFTPLHYALGGNVCNEEIVKELLNLRANLREVGGGLLPIHVALMNHNCSMDVISLLIQTGSPVSTQCSVGSPLFILLCRPDCDIDVVKLMLRNKADPNSEAHISPDRSFRKSLQLLRCSQDVYKIIENFNPHDLRFRSYRFARPLIAGLIQPNISADDYELLLKYGGNPNLIVLDVRSVLSVALESAELDIPKLRVLLKHGAKFCDNHRFPEQILFSRLKSKRVDLTLRVLQVLMEDYKDNFGDIKNSAGCNLLHHGFDLNVSPKYLNLLMKYYFPPDQIGPCGSSTLHHAVSSSCPLFIIESLLEQSTCVDVRDKNNNTPLHLAGERPEVVKLLIRYGADVTLVNSELKTPFRVYFENHGKSFQMLKNLIKALVLNEYLAKGYFDTEMFVNNLFLEPFSEERDPIFHSTMKAEELKKDLIPFVQDCQSELGCACTLDPAMFYLLVSRFSLKLHLKKGLIKSKNPNKEERLLSIKEKMFQTLHDKKLLMMIASKEIPLYEDFLLMLMNRDELCAIASELRIPVKTKGLQEFEYANPVSIFIVAQYLTLCDLDNLILAFIKPLRC